MADGMVRLWVPGCATGEEAYSLAMLLREQMDSLPAPPKVQVFATDIDDLAITTARFGRYPKTLLEGLSPERLSRFFTLSQDMYCVTKEIRELCTFLRSQSGSRSAVFDDEFALVPKFTHLHEPLASGSGHPSVSLLACSWGYLAFGGAESVAQHANLFETVDKQARIFRRIEGRSPELSLSWPQPDLTSQLSTMGE